MFYCCLILIKGTRNQALFVSINYFKLKLMNTTASIFDCATHYVTYTLPSTTIHVHTNILHCNMHTATDYCYLRHLNITVIVYNK